MDDPGTPDSYRDKDYKGLYRSTAGQYCITTVDARECINECCAVHLRIRVASSHHLCILDARMDDPGTPDSYRDRAIWRAYRVTTALLPLCYLMLHCIT